MEEMAYGLEGVNEHYGTPLNPAAPDRIPGGSSSGSASAVAAGLVDFALGSDTAGSVRVPANHCGILAFRPTHGRISLEGAKALQPSSDTVGWFARDAEVLRAVGHVLLAASSQGESRHKLTRWLVAEDAFAIMDTECSKAIYDRLTPHMPQLQELLGSPQEIRVGDPGSVGTLEDWADTILVLEGKEMWECHGEWVRRESPRFGSAIQERVEGASKVTEEQAAEAASKRKRIAEHVDGVLGKGAALAVPLAPGIAPLLTTSKADMEVFEMRTLALCTVSGAGGLPQVSLPVTKVHGCPVNLGLVAERGNDEALLDLTVELMKILSTAG
eukprot:SM000096S24903  [mRNA]  locus=s96:474879:476807:+ [translate_table: standard]